MEILTHFLKKAKSTSSKFNIWKLYENLSTTKAQKLSNSFLVFITLCFLSFSDTFLTIKPFLPDENCLFSEQLFLTISKNLEHGHNELAVQHGVPQYFSF